MRRGDTNMYNELKLAPEDPIPAGYFARCVSMSGNYAVIGRGEPVSLNTGAAYIFVKTSSGWSQQAKLTNEDAASFDAFGSSVAIDGEYAVVGAAGAGAQGKVYIFHRSDTSWVEVAQLTPASGDSVDYFGSSVSLSGDTLVVGSWNAAVIFRRTGSAWTQEAKLTDGASNQTLFGSSL